jgi:hypothetical protein
VNNPFDNAFDAVLRRKDEDRNRELRKQQEASARHQHARAVAEPYLLNVAPAVLRRLTDLGIGPITDPVSARVGPAPAPRTAVPYWPLQATYGPYGRITAL